MANKFLNNINLTAGLEADGSAGTSGQILKTTGSGVEWVNASTVIGGPYLPLAGGTMTGNLELAANTLNFADNGRARFGNSTDLQIYHNGSHSFIQDVGTGFLAIDTNGSDVRITKTDNEFMAKFITDAEVQLYYNGSKKFETTSTGVSVAGDARLANNGKLYLWNDHSSNYLDYRTWNASSSAGMKIENAAGNINLIPSGNVGIGTTSPAAKLHVSNAGFPQLNLESNAGSWQVGVSTGNDFVFRKGTSGSNYPLWLDSSGNVGIGTTSPSQKLEVEGNIYTSGAVRLKTTGAQLEFGNANVALQRTGNLLEIGGWDGIAFKSSNTTLDSQTERMRITSTGNVGIGTTSPGALLQLGYYPSNNIDITTYPNVPSEHMIHITAPETTNRYGGGISFGENAFTAANITVQDAGSNGSLHMLFGTRNTSGTVQERMRIDSSGQAFFKSSTDYKIGLNDSAGVNQWWFKSYTSGDFSIHENGLGDRFNIKAGGNVGIGTTSPSSKLTISASNSDAANNNTLRFVDTDVTTTANQSFGKIEFETKDTNNPGVNAFINAFAEGTGGTGALSFGTGSGGSTEKMRITSGGNVGIGTTSPSVNKLQVNGQVRVVGAQMIGDSTTSNIVASGVQLHLKNSGEAKIRLEDSDSSNLAFDIIVNEGAGFSIKETIGGDLGDDTRLFIEETTGNVGVGTTSPSFKLHVDSDVASGDVCFVHHDNPSQSSGTVMKIRSDAGDNAGSALLNIENNTGNALYVRGDRNVGIGTTSPDAKLHVSDGSFKVQSTTGTNRGVNISTNGEIDQLSTTTDWLHLQRNHNGLVAIGNNSTANLYVKNKAGIGTTSPGKKLEVVSNTTYDGIQISGLSIPTLGIIDTTNNAKFVAYVRDSDATIGTETNHPLTINTNNTERIRITSSGNVGIGTTSPGAKLEIGAAGTGVVAAKLTQAYEKVRINNFDLLGYDDGHLWMIGNNNSSIVLGASWDWDRQIEIAYSPQTTGTGNGILSIGQTTKNNANFTHGVTSFATNGVERMRIDSSGNVGIGTTSPGLQLDINSGTANSALRVLSTDRYTGIKFEDSLDNDTLFYDGQNNLMYLGTTNFRAVDLHATGNLRVEGAYYDSANSPGTGGQVLTSTATGTDWIDGFTTATSIYDLLPAARVSYDWTVQLSNGVWTDVFEGNDVITEGVWMVKVFVHDQAVGGTQWYETYSGLMSWGSPTSTNNSNASGESEIPLHRSGHSVSSGILYLRTKEVPATSGGDLKLQGMVNTNYTSSSTINFKFIKVF